MYYTYILTNRWRTVLYVGITNDLSKRVGQHAARCTKGFTSRYNADQLVHFEEYSQVSLAIAREKQIKGWTRKKKEHIINQNNPSWVDLSLANES